MAITNYDKALLLLPLSGSNNGTSFPDYSTVNTTCIVYGNTKTVTAQSKFYGSSAYFDGSGDYLDVPVNSQLSGTGDYTIEFWMRVAAYPGTDSPIISQFSSGSSNFDIEIMTDGKVRTYMGDAAVYYTSTGTVALNTWAHIALQRTSGTLKLFIDGIQEVSVSNSMDFAKVANQCKIGAAWNGTGGYTGYLQDFCIKTVSNGYSSGFTPPTSFLGAISGNVKDSSGANVQRNIVAFPRTIPTRAFTTTSDVSGNYSVTVPATECDRVVLDTATSAPMFNDIIDRVIAQ
jgi:hypothetical protein